MYSEGSWVNKLTSWFVAHSQEPVIQRINCTPSVSESSAIDFSGLFTSLSVRRLHAADRDTRQGCGIVCLTKLQERNMCFISCNNYDEAGWSSLSFCVIQDFLGNPVHG